MATSKGSEAGPRRFRIGRAAAAALILVGLALACRATTDAPLARFEYEAPAMGTRFALVLYAERREEADLAARAAFDELARLEALLSDWRESSELSALSRTSREPLPSPWTALSPELSEVLACARDVSEASGGAFDVTCGAATRLWRRAIREDELPAPEEIAGARADWRALELLPGLAGEAPRARFTRAGLRLDLGGIAKGYALDRMLAVLAAHGAPRALVVGGGDTLAGEPPPGRDAWIVELAGPTPGASPGGSLRLARAAVATSGDLYRALEREGVRRSHIVDPRTAQALETRAGASVIAPRAMLADALATAATVLGPMEAAVLARAFPAVELRAVSLAGGRERVFESAGFRALAGP